MVYTEDYVYVVCGSIAKWRDRKTPCTQRKKTLENCGIAPPSKLPHPTLSLLNVRCDTRNTWISISDILQRYACSDILSVLFFDTHATRN